MSKARAFGPSWNVKLWIEADSAPKKVSSLRIRRNFDKQKKGNLQFPKESLFSAYLRSGECYRWFDASIPDLYDKFILDSQEKIIDIDVSLIVLAEESEFDWWSDQNLLRVEAVLAHQFEYDGAQVEISRLSPYSKNERYCLNSWHEYFWNLKVTNDRFLY